jgi:hypothetical protein
MSRFNHLVRAVTCAASATLVTFVLGLGLVEATNAAPFAVTPAASDTAVSA